MNRLIDFLASSPGRILRLVAGIVLALVGILVGGVWVWALGIIGVVMMAAGVFDFCLFAPLARLPLSGPAIRAHQS